MLEVLGMGFGETLLSRRGFPDLTSLVEYSHKALLAAKCQRLDRETMSLGRVAKIIVLTYEITDGPIGFLVLPARCFGEEMEIIFKKMHGTMNDFIMFHDLDNRVILSADRIAQMCDRRAGIGADGVIVVRRSIVADFFMDYINADGSLAEMCGNGIRCTAKYAFDNGLTDKKALPVETRAGVKNLELIPGEDGKIERVRVDMGTPIFDPAKIPAIVPSEYPVIDLPIDCQDRVFLGTLVSMGNPHCVIFVDEDPDPFPRHYGPTIEKHHLFPAKTNVEFLRILDRRNILMRVWERGSGETFSCGTGACAAAVAANLKGLVDSSCVVHLLGGDLNIEWKGTTFPVIMTGSAVTVFEGSISI